MISETIDRTARETSSLEYRASDYQPAKWVDFRRGHEERYYIRYIVTATGGFIAQALRGPRPKQRTRRAGNCFDLAKVESQMRTFLQKEGEDLDQLLDRAAVHCSSPSLSPRTRPLTADEIAMLANDDDNALNG
jgi:hypothetical protein